MIQEKDFLYRVPVKTAPITTPKGQIRNPEILVDLEGGEFMHGNILDANSTNKLINQSVKEAVDNKIIEGGYVTKDLLDAETSARTNGDEDLNAKIKAEQTRAEGKEKEISDKLAIVDGDSNTEGSFRKAIADVIAAAPEDLDTLKEIADKLADSDDLHTALNQAITEKADASALANEVTRATSAESNLQAAIDTKADATALSNYVLTTALNQQVDTLNAAIDAKQDSGNYIPYETFSDSVYRLRNAVISLNDESQYTQTYIAIGMIDVQDNRRNSVTIRGNFINLTDSSQTKIYLDGENGSILIPGSSLDDALTLSRHGINIYGGDDNHVLTSNAGTIDITQYAKKSEVTDQIATKADTTALTALEQKVSANTTAITNVTTSKGIPYDPSVENVYSTDKDLAVKINDQSTAVFGPTSCISLKNAGINTLSLTYGGLQCKVGDQNKIDINPNTINQVTSGGYALSIDQTKIKQVANSYTFDVNSSDGIKWSQHDGSILSQINSNGLYARNSDTSYAMCNIQQFIDINAGGAQAVLNPNRFFVTNNTNSFEIDSITGAMQLLSGTSDDSTGLKLGYNGLHIGKKSYINRDNDQIISISVPFHGVTSFFEVSPVSGIMLQTGDSKVELGFNGVTLSSGDSNHVLTSFGTTIDITQYVLKSVYDEKIAALEARIEALEAKHPEAAS